MDLSKYTPDYLVRIIADGAFGVICFVPNIIGLICFALICFWLIDTLVSFVTGLINKRLAAHILLSQKEVGALKTRGLFWSGFAFGWLLKAWIGLPTFHVVNLIMHGDNKALTQIITGYQWQAAILEKLPLSSGLNLAMQPNLQNAISLAIVTTFLLFTYYYYSVGFDIVRSIRRIGDILLREFKLVDGTVPSPRAAYLKLRSVGWSREQATSSLWFLAMINARALMKIEIYESLTPAGYGLYKMVIAISIATSLAFLHPVASGLYVATKVKSGSKMLSLRALYKGKLGNLPKYIRTDIDRRDNKR